MTATVRDIEVEPLTEAAFAPFGELVSVKTRPPDFESASGTTGWRVDFRAGRPLVMVLRTPYQGLTFSKIERHFGVTQTFLPLGGSPAVLAVAPPTERDTIPDPGAIRAFLLDGTQGYLLRQGTWHSLDRLPLQPPDTRWVILTDHETQEDLVAGYRGRGGWRLSEEVDYAVRFGVRFVVRA